MIVTVTLNPSLDRAIEIDRLARGDVIRARSGHLDPGGKGVNVSRALLANGVASRAVLPCGGDEGAQLVRLLAEEGVDLVAVPIGGHTRSNITLAEPDGTVTKINEPGPTLSPVEFDAVTGQVLAAAETADWVVVSGSLPPGVTAESFGRLCRRIVASGVNLAVDTSGPALRSAAEAGAHLVKPNREELSDVVGGDLTSLSDVVEAARRVRTWGAGAVLASLGADGAVLVTAHTVVSGESPVDTPRSSVGAGDALLAGFLAAVAGRPPAAADIDGGPAAPHTPPQAADPSATERVDKRPFLALALAEGLAWGAAAVRLPGSRMPGPSDLRREAVVIHPESDPVRSLTPQG